MHAGASDALERLIGVIVVGPLIGGPSQHVLPGVGATIEKRPRHRTEIAQTKREAPARRAARAKSRTCCASGSVDIHAECSGRVNRANGRSRARRPYGPTPEISDPVRR